MPYLGKRKRIQIGIEPLTEHALDLAEGYKRLSAFPEVPQDLYKIKWCSPAWVEIFCNPDNFGTTSKYLATMMKNANTLHFLNTMACYMTATPYTQYVNVSDEVKARCREGVLFFKKMIAEYQVKFYEPGYVPMLNQISFQSKKLHLHALQAAAEAHILGQQREAPAGPQTGLQAELAAAAAGP